MNDSKSGLTPSGTTDATKTTGSLTDSVWSGPTGVDQSIQIGTEPPPSVANAGNRFPGLPPFKYGN